MKLYRKKGGRIAVYSINPKLKALREFRENTLKNSNIKDMFYTITTSNESVIKTVEKLDEINIKAIEYNFDASKNNVDWSILAPNSNLTEDAKKRILDSYFEGDYDHLKPIKVVKIDNSKKEILHFFISLGYNDMFSSIFTIDTILNVPQELYLLQLLEFGKLGLLQDEDITEQLELFDISYMRSVNICELDKMKDNDSFSGNTEDIIRKAEIGAKIIENLNPKFRENNFACNPI